MDMTTSHSLAGVLASLAGSKENNGELSLTNHVAQRLRAPCDEGEKIALAEILAALLAKFQDKYAEDILGEFVHDLVSTTCNSEEKKHKNLQLGARIVLALPSLLDDLVQKAKDSILVLISSALKAHVASDEAFEVDFRKFMEKHIFLTIYSVRSRNLEPSDFPALHNSVITRLSFLKIVLLTETNSTEETRIVADNFKAFPVLLPVLIGLRNEKISELSCHVFWLLLGKLDTHLPEGISEMIWEGIQILVEAPSHKDLAFNTWLRWVSLSGVTSRPSQNMLEEDKYWSLLQSGLATGYGERRKFCLYILNSSLRLTSKPISNTLLKYDPSSQKDALAWVKYSTMIEIISLSTSTNQFLAAVPDIRHLLRTSSPIAGSWMIVLMALGLTSSCGPLQKAVWEFILSLNGEELRKLLKEERQGCFINDVFLPYSIAAHHFSVRRGNDIQCEYGNKLAGFLKKIIVQSQSITGLLKFLDVRQDNIFAPARVYVLKGIVDGAATLPDEKNFGKSELAMIVNISKMKRFALMRTDLCISMCFKLLLSTNLKLVEMGVFFDALAEMFAGKEHLITSNFVKSLREFVSASRSQEAYSELISNQLETLSLALGAENGPPSRTIFRAAIILTLIRDGRGKQIGVDLLLKSSEKVEKRKNRISVQLLTLLFNGKGISGEWLQDPVSREILAKKLKEIVEHFLKDTQEDGFIAELANLLHHQREHHALKHIGTDMVVALLQKAWSIVSVLPGDDTFDMTTGKLRGDLTAVCDAARFALVDKVAIAGVQTTLATKHDALNLLVNVSLPDFGHNKHENTIKLKTTAKFIYYSYGLLNTAILRSPEQKLDYHFVHTFFQTTKQMLRYVDKGSLLRILDCMRTISRSASGIVGSYPGLDSVVRELWECAHVTSAVAEESLLEVSLIRTLFDTSIIRASPESNNALAEILSDIGQQILRLCKGKRSLAPAFAKTLRQGFLDSPDIFCSCEWGLDIFLAFINFTPSREPEFIVETPMAELFDEICSEPNHYEQYYEEKEKMAQVYIFDILSRLSLDSLSESIFADSLRNRIYSPWMLNKPGMPVYSKWKKASQLQSLLILERFITAEKSSSFLDTIIQTLCNEPHPRYRFIFEWMVALCIIRFPENRDCLWGHLVAPENPNPRLQASLLRVAIMVARELQEDLKEGFYTELLYTVIPLSNNNKVAVRHQATSMVLELWDDLVQWQHLRENVIFQRLRQSILNSEFFKQVIAAGKMEDERTFNARSNYTFAGIFAGSYLLGGDETHIIPPELFSVLEAPNPKRESFIPIGSVGQLEGSSRRVEYTRTEETALAEAPLQTKSGTWDAKAIIETTEHWRNKISSLKGDGPDIIVIASLIENAYNLGGLSRVSEIMGVKTLCFHSKDVLKLKDFTSVSVSSEVWLPISELKATAIPEYIRAKKLEGYSAVGIEQTDRSIILGGAYKLPKKVVLLLGSEKFGIPAELLAELDLCMEIPQKGETRSMNVQTAAAVVLYEFCRFFG